MNLPELKIGNLVAPIPIIQGGMAVRVSTAPLAAAVANEGGIGIIGASGMGIDELRDQIRKAKQLTRGIVGVNIMVALANFIKMVKAAIEEKIDLIIAGAGFSKDLFHLGKDSGIPVVPIVSSLRLAKIAESLGASAIVVEGKEAGGHLGTDVSIKELIPSIVNEIKIPVVAAGGIMNGNDVAEMFKMGVDGVQMATRFVASKECEVSDKFKQIYLNANKEDIVIIRSPVGLPGRAIRNEFSEKLMHGEAPPPENCDNCLKHCSGEYCILQALDNSRLGNTENGVVFSGEYVYKLKDILTVKEIFKRILDEVKRY
ncbi:MAG: nitronate monooxygenase [Candidatus Firestonebacteria bacterium]|nr:nitronate monooxygenase [Candidatus Firestonebacteria bacterium]